MNRSEQVFTDLTSEVAIAMLLDRRSGAEGERSEEKAKLLIETLQSALGAIPAKPAPPEDSFRPLV
jgi:hypothetical protein